MRNKVTGEAKAAARRLVEDPDYLKTLRGRLITGMAGPMEALIWAYAYGRPTEGSDEGSQREGNPECDGPQAKAT